MSVRLSHSGILSKRLNIYPLSFFSPSDSHTILVFSYQRWLQYSDRDPLTGPSCRGGTKNRDFQPASRFVSWYKMGIVGRLLVNHTWSIEGNHFIQWPWTISNPDFRVSPLFDAECLRNGKYDIEIAPSLVGVCSSVTRGHSLRLQQIARNMTYANRIVNIWNSLPSYVVSAETVNCFKQD